MGSEQLFSCCVVPAVGIAPTRPVSGVTFLCGLNPPVLRARRTGVACRSTYGGCPLQPDSTVLSGRRRVAPASPLVDVPPGTQAMRALIAQTAG